jgi:putative two-component system response regulator
MKEDKEWMDKAVEAEKEEEQIELKKIIYIDDIQFHLLSLKERLNERYEIYTTQSVEKMFEIISRVKPDLILLDVNMPEVNGFEAIGQLKADRRYAEIPIIFLTAQKDKKSIITGMSLGASDFIVKPYTNDELINCIEYQFDTERQQANRPIILAVDDNPSILQSLTTILSDKYTVFTVPEVKSEQMLRELLKRVVPDLFILDYHMPGMSGFDLIPIIRKIPEHEETPIVFLTSEGTVDNLSAAIHLGACDFMTKPIDDTVLRKRIATHLYDYIMRRRIRLHNEDKWSR